MKKSMLALALTGAFAVSVHAQSSVTLYGVIDTGIVYTNNQTGHSNWQMGTSSTQNTVFGLKGSEELGGGLHTVFKLEQGFNLNNGTQAFPGDGFGSQAWVGLQSDPYGTVTFGRQFDVLNDVLGPLTAGSNTWGGNMAAHPFENDNLAADSVVVNNTVKYVSPTWSGITFEGMYAFSNKAGGFANNRAYGFGVSYAQGPVNLAGGYLQFSNPGGASSAPIRMAPFRKATVAPTLSRNVSVSGAQGVTTRSARRPSDWCGAIRRSTTWRASSPSASAATCRSAAPCASIITS